jgi:hypothetical protein
MRTSDKIFIIPIILLAANFLYRLIDFSKIIFTFPLDTINDVSSYIALVHFLDIYGFLGNVPNWYNGFILFNTYAPGWTFFTYPLYKITSNLLLSTYLSTILLFIIGLLGIYLIGKELKISKTKIIAFFLLVFANPMMIGGILKQGRLPSLMALVILVYITYIVIYFKDKPLSARLLLLSLFYALMILTHQAETILSSIFLLGFILIKNNKEKILIILSLILGVLLSSFWLIPFIKSTITTQFLNLDFSNWLLNFHSYLWNNLAGILISISLFILFYLYYTTKKENILLFSPLLVLNFLYLTRLCLFIPIIKYIYPDPYTDFFTFFSCLLLFSIDFGKISKKIKTILLIILIIASLASVSYNLFKTPYFQKHTQNEIDFLSLTEYIDGKYLIFNEPATTFYSRPYYSYAAIYYNKTTISGWADMYKDQAYILELNKLSIDFRDNKNCEDLAQLKEKFGLEEVLADGAYCNTLINECNLNLIIIEKDTCLVSI